ncbi:MAG: hypothetical protein LBQ50_07585 [Planctomycetaceae bacterium]|nr:hypothetical protein [Planctomycetaceae bacterium]
MWRCREWIQMNRLHRALPDARRGSPFGALNLVFTEQGKLEKRSILQIRF